MAPIGESFTAGAGGQAQRRLKMPERALPKDSPVDEHPPHPAVNRGRKPLSLLLIVVIAVIILGERPSLQEWVGVAKVGAGVMVLALK